MSDPTLPRVRRSLALVLGVLALTVTVVAQGASAPASPAAANTDWTMADLLPSVVDLGSGHDFERGRQLFTRAGCGLCHGFGSEAEGAGLAPDLTGVGSKYTRDFILQSILEPSATLNGQFFHTTFTMKDGSRVTGSIVDTVAGRIVVAPVMMNPSVTIDINQADVVSEAPSPVSPMPSGLLNPFTRDEIIELLAFLDAGGDRAAAVYRRR